MTKPPTGKPPTGTVTLLFTDIEGSTTRWEQYPLAMRVALARHDEILRTAINAYGGYVFKTIGDAFCAAFVTAPAALAAAVQAQRHIAAHDWGEIGSLRVRMSLYSGVAQERDGDYFGSPLNRVARLLSAGHGGQTLLGHATQELVHDFLPAGASLRDLGEHRLRDLAQPEHIHQLVVDGLPADFPPLRSLNNRPNNLPAQLTALIGRDKEIEAVRNLLRSGGLRLLTLTGTGGTGKTRLAVHAVAGLLDDYEDGVFVVCLASTSDPALVASVIAETLGVKEVSGQLLVETLKIHLHARHLLVVLDNFEQIIAAAPLVIDLLAACPHVKVLTTSRTSLKISGEHEFPVPPLALPKRRPPPTREMMTQYAAVQLFIERAQAVKPDFTLTNDNVPAIAEICHRLDGLPLAIELAAARIKVLCPLAMLKRLESRLNLLTGGPRDRPERHQTLRAAIAWSYELLDETEQALFRRLSVFVGSTLVAIDTVISDATAGGQLTPYPVDVLNVVSSLLDNSLLWQRESDDEPRFFMLETIHEYADERLLESGEAIVMRRQHAYFFLALAEEAYPKLLGSVEQAAWLGRLEREHGNLRAALSWLVEHEPETGLRLAVALARFWRIIGHDTELRMALQRALERGSTAPAGVRIVALREMGEVLLRSGDRGDYERARGLLEESVQLCRDTGDFKNLAWTLRKLGEGAHFTADNAEKAREFYKESLAIEWDRGDKNGVAATYSYLGSLARDAGDLEDARALYEESAAIFDTAQNTSGVARAFTHLAAIAYIRDDCALARSYYEKCLPMLRNLKDKAGLSWALGYLGELALRHGDYESAWALHEEYLEIKRQLEDDEGIVCALWGLAEVARQMGRSAQASSFLDEAAAIASEPDNKTILCRPLTYRVQLAAAAGQWIWAARLLGAVESICEGNGLAKSEIQRGAHARITAEIRAALGEESFLAALTAGRSMTIEEAAGPPLEKNEVP